MAKIFQNQILKIKILFEQINSGFFRQKSSPDLKPNNRYCLVQSFTITFLCFSGGSNGHGKILDITRGHFEDGFTGENFRKDIFLNFLSLISSNNLNLFFLGCLRNVVIQNIEVFAHLNEITGKNISPCSPA